jgi:hypothetical protein
MSTSIQSMYVHGAAVAMRYAGGNGSVGSPHTPGHQMNAVVEGGNFIDWTDIIGLRHPHGVTFRGRAGQRNQFLAAIPTPTWHNGFARLQRVALRFKSDPGVNIVGIGLSDGNRDVAYPFPTMALGGDHLLSWEPNVNFFDNADKPQIESAVCIAVNVLFASEGEIVFAALGCDFEVID